MTNRRTFGTVRELSKGRFQARYLVAGERFNAPHRFTSRKDANAWLAKTETSISKGTWVSPKTPVKVAPNFGEYSVAWLAKRKLTPRTRNEYQSMLTRLIWPEFATSRLDGISRSMVKDWFADLGPTPTQNAHAYSLLTTIFNTAVEDQVLDASPCHIKNATKVKRAKDINVLSAAQVREMAAKMPERFRVLLLITAFCCLRFGEVTELRRKDFVNGTLKVRRGVTWLKGGSIVGQPKTDAGVRVVPVWPSLRPLLAAHILQFAEPGEDGLIFPAIKGGHLSHGSLTNAFDPVRVALGRAEFSWHGLRHTGAVIWAADSEIRLKDLMALLGHETPAMALLYQHVVEGKLDQAANRLDHHMADVAMV